MNTFQTRSSISLPDDNFHPLTSLRPESSSSSINPGNNTVELTAITRAIEPHRRILGAILTHPIANLNRLIGRWSIDAQWNRLAPSFASALPLSLSLSLSGAERIVYRGRHVSQRRAQAWSREVRVIVPCILFPPSRIVPSRVSTCVTAGRPVAGVSIAGPRRDKRGTRRNV